MVAGMTFLTIAAPTGLIRDQLISMVKQKTGRDLVINGDTSFSFFPNLGVKITKVSLSGPPSNPKRLLLNMDGLTANVSLLPLLSKKIEVNSFVLTRPVFDLWVDKQGIPSWQFARLDAPQPTNHASTAPRARLILAADKKLPDELQNFVNNSGANNAALRSAERLEGLFKDLRLQEVMIKNGRLRYADQRTGAQHAVDDIDVELDLDTLDNPLNAKGELKWKNETINFDSELASPKDMLLGRNSKLVLNISSKPAHAKFNGQVSISEGLNASGKLSAKTPALDRLLNWVAPGSAGSLGGGASVDTNIALNPSKIQLDNIKFALRGAKGDGNITVATDGARPNITGNIHLGHLDLTKLLSGDSGRLGDVPTSRGGMGKDLLVDDLNKISRGETKLAQAARAKSASSQTGWSTAPIDLAALNSVDSQVVLTVDRLNHGNVKMTEARLVTLLKNGLLRINVEKILLYGGRGTGRVSVDGGRGVPQVSASMLVNGVSALPLLKDAAAFDWIDGRGQLAINVAGRGKSQDAIIRSLKGDGRINFNDGALVGINIPQLVRSFQTGQISGFKKDAAQKTDFSELSGTFVIANGVASNKDLRLVGPLLRLSGAGQVNMPQKSLDYLLKPKLVASFEGQGGGALDGIEVPLNVKGPWASPSITPDLQSLLANPEKTVETAKKMFESFTKGGGGIKDLKKNIEGGDVGAVLKGLFGN